MQESVGMSGLGFTRTLAGFCRRITPPVWAGHNDRASRGATRRIVRSAPTSSTRPPSRVLALYVFPRVAPYRTSLLRSVPAMHPPNNRLLYCAVSWPGFWGQQIDLDRKNSSGPR
jgi:hypothetical protein